MKKLLFVSALALSIFASCNDKKAETTAQPEAQAETKTVKIEGDSFEPTTNIRYYNLDTVMANYELVKTFNAANLRTMNNLQAAQNSRESELNRMAENIQKKMQSNGYLSEASYNADVAELNRKQQEAQNYLGNLQMKAQQEALNQQAEFLDSVDNFLAVYNREKHYDAILTVTPGTHFNRALDITKEVVDGLNARYTATHPATTEANAKAEK